MDSELANDRQHYASARFARALRLEDEHLRALLEMRQGIALYRTGQDLVRVGEAYKYTMLLEQGWALRFKLLADGRRQVINLYLPGDALCLEAATRDVADYTVTALTDCSVVHVDPWKFVSWGASSPVLSLALLHLKARDEAALTEHIVSLGRRSACERTAHLLLHLAERIDEIYGRRNWPYRFPLTQSIIADILGLSTVHVNRTLRGLQDQGLVRVERAGGMVLHILDLESLKAAAEL